MNKVTFFLMSYKGYSTLKAFIKEFGTDIIDFVVTSKDSSVQNDYYRDIKDLCLVNRVKCFDRKDVYNVNTDYAFAISWRWLIKLSNTTLVVFHDSLLPKYRGFAPLATALINGDKEVGVTAPHASEKYDNGDIIGQSRLLIHYPIKINDAISLISDCYFNLVKEITTNIIASKPIKAVKQDESQASFSLWLDDRDYAINWTNDANFIKRFIDSIGFPFKGAATTVDGERFRILDANVVDDVEIPQRHPGKVIFMNDSKPVVVCGKGLLQINEMVDDKNEPRLPLKKFRTRFE